MFYLPLCFFYCLAKLIIYTIDNIYSRGTHEKLLKRIKKNTPSLPMWFRSYVFLQRSAPIFEGGSPHCYPRNFLQSDIFGGPGIFIDQMTLAYF